MLVQGEASDHLISVALRRAGVKQSAWGNTLPLLKQDTLRAFIVSGDYLNSVAYIHAASSKDTDVYAYLAAMETFAKEMVLSKVKVFLCDYAELSSLLTRESEFLTETQSQLRDANMIIVRDFVDVTRTVDKDSMAFITAWLLRCFASGVAIALGGNVPLTRAGDLFYMNSVMRLAGTSVSFPIARTTGK